MISDRFSGIPAKPLFSSLIPLEAISLSDRIIVLSRRPATVSTIIPVTFSLEHDTPLNRRNAPEFKTYFNSTLEGAEPKMKLLHKLPVPFLRIWNHHSDSEKNSLPGYISPEQLIFLKKIRHHRQFVFTARILLLILFLLQWELCANAGIVDSFIFSSPSRIARCFWEMTLDQSIFLHIGITLYETLASFACVTLFSLLVAVLLWSSRKLSEILEPYLVVLNSLPKSPWLLCSLYGSVLLLQPLSLPECRWQSSEVS